MTTTIAMQPAASAPPPWQVVRGGDMLPHSEECEELLIASVLLDETGGAWAVAVNAGAKAAAFHGPQRRLVWLTLERLHARGSPLGILELVEELRVRGELDDAGGMEALMAMSRRVGTTAQVRNFAEQLVLLWQLRHTLQLAVNLREAVWNFESREQYSEALGEVGQKLIRFGRREAVRSLPEVIESVKAEVIARMEGKEDRSRWLSSGLAGFDERCRPFGSAREDHMIGVVGGSSHGKSALMRQFALNALKAGKRILFYTRETSIDGLIEQMAATEAGVNLMRCDDTLPERRKAFEAMCDLLHEWAGKRLWCVQHEPATPLETVEDLESHYLAFENLYGAPDLVVVDYLQIFGTKKRCNSREQEVAFVSHKFQALCRRAGNVWMIGAQMNESGLAAQRTLKRDDSGKVIHRTPVAGDLRESQAFYHDCDRVIALYLPPVDCRDQDQTAPNILKPEEWLCQIKRRRGGTGAIKCWFEKVYTRFVELRRDEVVQAAAQAAANGAPSVPGGGMSTADWKKRKVTGLGTP